MYKALYRKYRPNNFDDVVGQKTIITTLKNSIKNNKISHAYLFSGPRGTGKTSVAKIFAEIINCEQKESLIKCNNCEFCKQKNKIDIIEIDAASNNGIDEIRELKNKINLVPNIGKYKVYIIDEIHMLTTGAFNALLKTLEEPPAHVIFILATTDIHKIPITILSRCQKFSFNNISIDGIKEKLNQIITTEKIKIEEKAINEIAQISNGGLRDSINMLDQLYCYCDNNITKEDVFELCGIISDEEIYKILKNIYLKNISEIIKKLDEYNKKGKNFIKIIEKTVLFLKNSLLYIVANKYISEQIANKNQINLYVEMQQIFNSKQILNMLEEYNNCLEKCKFLNDYQLLFEISTIKISSQFLTPSTIIPKLDKNSKEENIENRILKTQKIQQISKNELNLNNQLTNIDCSEIKKIRINNTLSCFNKNNYLKIKKEIKNINKLMLIPEYSKYISVILDGEIKAVGDKKNIIFVYKTNEESQLFNENIYYIEKIISKLFQEKYKVISTDKSNWEIIKNNFNNKKIKYEYKEESKDLLKNIEPKNKDEIKDFFGDIVEYS